MVEDLRARTPEGKDGGVGVMKGDARREEPLEATLSQGTSSVTAAPF